MKNDQIDKSEFFHQYFCELNEAYSVIVEDDGRVAYAYLLVHENIIGDIWLYNQAENPLSVNWIPEDMPFLNPKEYLTEEIIRPIIHQNELDLKWSLSDEMTINKVVIYIRNKMIAKLALGSTPGWSTVVVKDGPLARVL